MNRYALIKDSINDNIFGVVVDSNGLSKFYGVSAKGIEWSKWANGVSVKSADNGLPVGVVVGEYSTLRNQNSSYIQALVETVSLRNPSVNRKQGLNDSYIMSSKSVVPAVRDAEIRAFDIDKRADAINFKARAFRTDSKVSSLLTQVRTEQLGFVSSEGAFSSRNPVFTAEVKQAEIIDTYGRSIQRSIGKNIIRKKSESMVAVVPVAKVTESGIQFKAAGLGPKIGSRLGGGLRSAPAGMSFVDITGVTDADTDGIVFEGKPGLERPIIPRFIVPKDLARKLSGIVEGDAEAIEKQRRAGNTSVQFDEGKLRKIIESVGGDANLLKSVTGEDGIPATSPSGRQRLSVNAPRSSNIDRDIARDAVIGGRVRSNQRPDLGDPTPLSPKQIADLSEQELVDRLIEDRFAGLNLEEAANKYGLKGGRAEARRLEAREMQRRRSGGMRSSAASEADKKAVREFVENLSREGGNNSVSKAIKQIQEIADSRDDGSRAWEFELDYVSEALGITGRSSSVSDVEDSVQRSIGEMLGNVINGIEEYMDDNPDDNRYNNVYDFVRATRALLAGGTKAQWSRPDDDSDTVLEHNDGIYLSIDKTDDGKFILQEGVTTFSSNYYEQDDFDINEIAGPFDTIEEAQEAGNKAYQERRFNEELLEASLDRIDRSEMRDGGMRSRMVNNLRDDYNSTPDFMERYMSYIGIDDTAEMEVRRMSPWGNDRLLQDFLNSSIYKEGLNDFMADELRSATPESPVEVANGGDQYLNSTVSYDGEMFIVNSQRYDSGADEYVDGPGNGEEFDSLDEAEDFASSILDGGMRSRETEESEARLGREKAIGQMVSIAETGADTLSRESQDEDDWGPGDTPIYERSDRGFALIDRTELTFDKKRRDKYEKAFIDALEKYPHLFYLSVEPGRFGRWTDPELGIDEDKLYELNNDELRDLASILGVDDDIALGIPKSRTAGMESRVRSDEPGLLDNEVAGDMTLDEVSSLSDSLDMFIRRAEAGNASARDMDALNELRDAFDTANAANDMVVMDRDNMRRALDFIESEYMRAGETDSPIIDDGGLTDVLGEILQADSEGEIWESLPIQMGETRLSMPSSDVTSGRKIGPLRRAARNAFVARRRAQANRGGMRSQSGIVSGDRFLYQDDVTRVGRGGKTRINLGDSRAVRALTWDDDNSNLIVTYGSGKTYTYLGVDDDFVRDLEESPESIGKIVNRIKNSGTPFEVGGEHASISTLSSDIQRQREQLGMRSQVAPISSVRDRNIARYHIPEGAETWSSDTAGINDVFFQPRNFSGSEDIRSSDKIVLSAPSDGTDIDGKVYIAEFDENTGRITVKWGKASQRGRNLREKTYVGKTDEDFRKLLEGKEKRGYRLEGGRIPPMFGQPERNWIADHETQRQQGLRSSSRPVKLRPDFDGAMEDIDNLMEKWNKSIGKYRNANDAHNALYDYLNEMYDAIWPNRSEDERIKLERNAEEWARGIRFDIEEELGPRFNSSEPDYYGEDDDGYDWDAFGRGERQGMASRMAPSASRIRAAEMEVSSRPRGMASRRSEGLRDPRFAVPGANRVDPSDGQLWARLSDEDKQTVAERATQREKYLLNEFKKRFPTWWRRANGEAEKKGWDKDLMRGGNEGWLDELHRFVTKLSDDPNYPEKSRLEAEKEFNDLQALFNMRRNRGEYDLLEHLHPTSRRFLFDDARRADGKTTKISASGKEMKTPSTAPRPFGEPIDVGTPIREQVGEKQKKPLKERLDAYYKRMSDKILYQDPARKARREMRKARRQGINVGGFSQEEASPVDDAKRKIRKRKRLKEMRKYRNRDAGTITESSKKNRVDGRLAHVDDAGEMVFGEKLVPTLSTMMDNLRTSKKMKKTTGSTNRNKALAVLWDGAGYNGTPSIITPDEFKALHAAGWIPVVRGHGNGSNGVRYADDWIDSPIRFIPGQGGEAQGEGEYWARATQGGGGWFSWMDGSNPAGTVALLPPATRRVGIKELRTIQQEHAPLAKAIKQFDAGLPEGEREKMNAEEYVMQLRDHLRTTLGPTFETTMGTRMGKMTSRILDSLSGSNAADKKQLLDALEFLEVMSKQRTVNGYAPLLGYDSIIAESGVELIHNRTAIAVVGDTFTRDDAVNLAKSKA